MIHLHAERVIVPRSAPLQPVLSNDGRLTVPMYRRRLVVFCDICGGCGHVWTNHTGLVGDGEPELCEGCSGSGRAR